MAEKKNFLDILKEALSKDKVIMGSKQVIKHLKIKDSKLIVVANNCPENIRDDIKHYAEIAGLEVEEFNGTAKQLGIFCGKPFSIAALSIKK